MLSLQIIYIDSVFFVMYRYRINYLFFFVAVMCFSCKHVEKTYYPDGQLEAEATYRGGKLDGHAVWYYEHGKKRMEIDYVSGKKHGTMRRFFRNGSLETQQTFENDTLIGLSQEYSDKGVLISEITYEKGLKNGNFKEFYQDGTPAIEGGFVKDMYEGVWKYYDAEGYLIGEANFSNGNGTVKMFDTEGIVKQTVPYKNNLIDGEEIYYDKNGNIEKTILYSKGRLQKITNNQIIK